VITTTAEHRLVMDARTEPRWLIDGFIGQTPALLYADPKVGKTFLAVNMVAALIDGAPTFLDGPTVNGPVPCLYVALDRGGKDEITERLEGLTTTPTFITGDLDEAEILKTVTAEGIRFVVLDNVTRILKGVDNFNDPGSIEPLTSFIEEIEELDAAVLTIHHTSKPSKDTPQSGRSPSGTYALMAYFRQLIEMTPNQIVLRSNYVKNGKQVFGIRAEPAGEHGVRYQRRHDVSADSEGRRSRRKRVREPSTYERRTATVTSAAVRNKAEAVEAISRTEPTVERGTIRRYVGEHAEKWGLK
jgi:hypothetical protein